MELRFTSIVVSFLNDSVEILHPRDRVAQRRGSCVEIPGERSEHTGVAPDRFNLQAIARNQQRHSVSFPLFAARCHCLLAAITFKQHHNLLIV